MGGHSIGFVKDGRVEKFNPFYETLRHTSKENLNIDSFTFDVVHIA